jgi:hypothetical protein
MGYRSARRICFVFAHYTEGLLSAIVAKNCYGATKTNPGGVCGIEDDACAAMPRVPISQIPGSGGYCRTVTRCLRTGIGSPRGNKRSFYLRHSFLCNVIWKLRDVPVRQFFERFDVLFLDKCSAHFRA